MKKAYQKLNFSPNFFSEIEWSTSFVFSYINNIYMKFYMVFLHVIYRAWSIEHLRQVQNFAKTKRS